MYTHRDTGTMTENIKIRQRKKTHLFFETTAKQKADFSTSTIKARRLREHVENADIFKMLKENNCQRRILYPVKLIFRNEGNLNVFSGKGQENLSSIDLRYKNTFSSSG